VSPIDFVNNKDLKFEIYPNPNQGKFSLKCLSKTGTKLNVKVYSLTGQLVYNESWVAEARLTMKKVELKNATGLYLIQVSTDYSSAVQSVLIK
jgi:hypothetical protein